METKAYPAYSVAIRTLGKSGDYFVRTIKSLKTQTVPPKDIFIYIAEGYQIPPRVADEVYVTCRKGMVAQRALPFSEIETELVLLSDDDMEYAPDSIEKLLSGMMDCNGDCIAANVFPNHKWDFKHKVIQAIFHGIYPSLSRKYAFRIRKDASYSYSLFPRRVMESQSCAGAVLLLYKSVLSNLHFHEEEWMDSFQYALGDDQLFGYKIHCLNYRLLVHYDTGVVHLDAGTGQVKDQNKADYNQRILKYIIWYRSVYEPGSMPERLAACFSFYSKWCLSIMWAMIKSVRDKGQKLHNITASRKEALAFIDSPAFSSIPKWPQK